jgi:hypothetical protein
MAKYATIDDYIAALPGELPAVADAARRVIDARLEGADSAIKWAHPTWSLGKLPVCYLKARRSTSRSASGTARRSTTRPGGSRRRAP